MTAVLWLLVVAACWLALAAPVAVLVGRAIDPREAVADYDEFEPLGVPVDCLGPLEVDFEFRRLTDRLEAERNTRLGGLW